MKKLIIIASLFIIIGLIGLSLNSTTNVNIINNHNKINTVSPDINNYNSLLSNKFYYEKSLNISGYPNSILPSQYGYFYSTGNSFSNNNRMTVSLNYFNFTGNTTTNIINYANDYDMILSNAIYNNYLFYVVDGMPTLNNFYVCFYKMGINNHTVFNISKNIFDDVAGTISNQYQYFNTAILSNNLILNFAGNVQATVSGFSGQTAVYDNIVYNLTNNIIEKNYYLQDFGSLSNWNFSYNLVTNGSVFQLTNLLNYNNYYFNFNNVLYMNNVTINNNIEYINNSNYQIVFNFITNAITTKNLIKNTLKGAYAIPYSIYNQINNITSRSQTTGNFISAGNFLIYQNGYFLTNNNILYIVYNNSAGFNQIAIFTSQIYHLNISSINVQDGLRIGNYYYWNGVISSQSSYQFISIPSNPIIPLNYSGYIYKGSVVKLTAGDFHNGYYNLTFYYNSENVNIGYNFNDFYYPIMELGLVFLISSFLYMTTRYYKKDIQVMVI